MRQIQFQLLPPEEWFAVLHQQLPARIIGNEFLLNKEFGYGRLKYLKVQEGLWVKQMNFTLVEKLGLYRKAKDINDFFQLNFYLSNAEIKEDGVDQSYKLGFDKVSILLTSATTDSEVIILPDKKIRIFNISFSLEWLKTNVLTGENQVLKQVFETNKPIYLAENLDYKFKSILSEIDLDQNNRLTLFSKIIQLLDYFFIRLRKRKTSSITTSKIHHEDLEMLMKVRNVLDSNFEETILVKNLSQLAGMSLSKFKRLFKQIFGLTPYRYHLQIKMEKAMEMLAQKKYSVSETGFNVGYANLSHFTKAFKNHFGILPSEVT